MVKNVRKSHLFAISKKVAIFIANETYNGEDEDIQKQLAQVVAILDEVGEKCEKRDEAAEKNQ